MIAIGVLHEQIEAAGIPIDGVSVTGSGAITIQFRPGATQAQRDQAVSIATAFDKRPRRPRSIASLITDIQALTAADRTKLFAVVAALTLRENPRLAEKFNIAVGGDEPDV